MTTVQRQIGLWKTHGPHKRHVIVPDDWPIGTTITLTIDDGNDDDVLFDEDIDTRGVPAQKLAGPIHLWPPRTPSTTGDGDA
jgi:hypothetical protein